MGYTTYFNGEIEVNPPLNKEEVEFLLKFARTRRMKRTKGEYFVDGTGYAGQGNDPDVIDHNQPPVGQPSLWCQWVPSDDGEIIQWDGGEKFYSADLWMAYLIRHFIGKKPIAKKELPFLKGHVCNGVIDAQGEDGDDKWRIEVVDNAVYVSHAEPTTYGNLRRLA